MDSEEILFDADKDNNGEGFSLDELVCLLKAL